VRYFGFRSRIFYILDETCQVQNLPFAQQLLGQVRFKVLDFLGQRAHQIGLLHALGVHQLVLAKLQNQTVIQAQGQHADHQERAKNKPEDAHMAGAKAFPQGPKRWRGGQHLNSQF
jgi:hypothetical protein